MTPTPPIRNIPAPTITPMRNNPNLFLTRVSNVDTSTSAWSPRIWLRALVSDRSPETATVRDARSDMPMGSTLRPRPAGVDPGRVCQHAAMVANGPSLRLLPRLSDDVAFFWTSGADGVLRLLRCNACGFFIHPPGPVCRRCLSRDLAPQEVSGRGRVETFTVNYQQWIPGSDPYIIAWVSIDEQPDVRLTTNLVDVEPEDVRIGLPVRVRLRARRRRLAPALHARRRGGRVVSPGRSRSRWSGGPSSRASGSPTSGGGSGAPTST